MDDGILVRLIAHEKRCKVLIFHSQGLYTFCLA